jgi:hypothetical protein
MAQTASGARNPADARAMFCAMSHDRRRLLHFDVNLLAVAGFHLKLALVGHVAELEH